LFRPHAEHRRRDFEQYFLGLGCRHLDRIAGDIGRAAGDGAGIHRRCIGVARNHMDIGRRDAEFLGRDLAQHRQGALSGLDRTGQHRRRAVFIDLDDRGTGIGGNGKPDRVPHAGDAASSLFH
jgi:hypothetical protein